MNESAIDRRWQVAHQLSVVAGKQTLTRFQNRDLAVDRKGDDTPVTEADRDAEKLLR